MSWLYFVYMVFKVITRIFFLNKKKKCFKLWKHSYVHIVFLVFKRSGECTGFNMKCFFYPNETTINSKKVLQSLHSYPIAARYCRHFWKKKKKNSIIINPLLEVQKKKNALLLNLFFLDRTYFVHAFSVKTCASLR